MGKILLVISIVFTLASAGVGFLNRDTLVKTKTDLAATNTKLTTTTASLETANGELKKTADQLVTVTADKETALADLTTTKEQLTKSASDLTALSTQVGEKDTQIAALDAQVKELLEKTGGGSTPTEDPRIVELTAAVAEKEALVNQLQAKTDTQTTQLEEFRKRDEERRTQLMRKGLEGKILAVNNAWNFVVLNLGDRNGVVNNAEMLIKRGNQLIGKIRVTSVEPSTSIADIVSSSVPGEISIQPGDQVIAPTEDE